jgi:hypothetical protein
MDELELLRAARPDPGAPGAMAQASAHGALAEAIAHKHRGHPPARLAYVAALAAAVAAVIVALLGGFSSAGAPGPQPALAASTVLERLAVVAAHRPRAFPRAHQYLVSESWSLHRWTYGTAPDVCETQNSEHRQTWIAPDGSGLLSMTDGTPKVTAGSTPRCARWLAEQLRSPRPGALEVSDEWGAPGCFSLAPVPLKHLPLDPYALRARLLTGKIEGGPRGPAEAFEQAGDLLRHTDASPALRAALYRAAAGLAGVRNEGPVSDHLGRSGVGLSVTARGERHVLIFDPRTSELLGERFVSTRDGHELEWAAYEPLRVANSLPRPSPLPLTPRCTRGGQEAMLRVPGHPHQGVRVGVYRSLERRAGPPPT